VNEGRAFARNSAFNLFGLLLPLVVAVVAIPPLVRGLGVERFGILTLAWAAIGYFSLFEFGMSRALTQAAALRLTDPDAAHDMPELAWSALTLLFGLGIVGGALVASLTPLVVEHLLNVPVALHGETKVAFYLLALSLPFVLTTVGLRGLMEAHQHFGAVNALRVPLVISMFVGPLLILPFSHTLVAAVGMLVTGRILTWLGHVILCVRRYAYLRVRPRASWRALAPLLRYGGWITVTNIVSPVMVYLDRFLIGALLPMAAVAQYVTPYEVVTKLLVIPGAILGAMFPAFAAAYTGNPRRASRMYDRATRSVLIAIFPIVLITVAFAHEGLNLWVGGLMPEVSALVMRWLAIGVFVNALGQVPYAALQGAGRPDAIAKLHVAELPLYVAGIWALSHSLGLVGVALAWTLRVTVDTSALLVIARRTLGLPVAPMATGRAWAITAMLAALGVACLGTSAFWRVAYTVTVLSIFAAISARYLLSSRERDALLRLIVPPTASSPEGGA
jgi:O-antigen/teichoic acid export membrane protein